MQTENAVRQFRRTTRRLSADFIAGRIRRDTYISAVRAAALDANLILDSGKRRTMGDRILDVLAWSTNPLAPGELPASLEPHFEQFQHGTMDFGTLRGHVTHLITRASQRPSTK